MQRQPSTPSSVCPDDSLGRDGRVRPHQGAVPARLVTEGLFESGGTALEIHPALEDAPCHVQLGMFRRVDIWLFVYGFLVTNARRAISRSVIPNTSITKPHQRFTFVPEERSDDLLFPDANRP